MAIYSFHVKVRSRSENRSKNRKALKIASYCSGDKLYCEATNETYQRKKGGVVHSTILAPTYSPALVFKREELWNRVEKKEIRKNAQLLREIIVALPRELNLEQQIELLSKYIQEEFVSLGMIADYSIHYDKPGNPHAHILLTMRKIDENGCFLKKEREWNNRKLLKRWREKFADITNESLNKYGFNMSVSHKSYAARGIDKIPTKHEGEKTRNAKNRGIYLPRAIENAKIQFENTLLLMKKKIFSNLLNKTLVFNKLKTGSTETNEKEELLNNSLLISTLPAA